MLLLTRVNLNFSHLFSKIYNKCEERKPKYHAPKINDLFTEKNCQTALNELKQLVSVTPHDYQVLYHDVIIAVAEFIQESQASPTPSEQKSEVVKETLETVLARAIATLKFRRTYMLPMGSDTETCYQQQDVWTYALFTAALIKDLRKEEQDKEPEDVSAFTKPFIPDIGFHWLRQYETLFKAWLGFLNGDEDLSNTITLIIKKAEAHSLGKKVISENVILEDVPVSPVEKTVIAERIKIIKENESSKEKLKTVNPRSRAASLCHPSGTHLAEEKIPEILLADRFLIWLKQSLVDHTLVVNKPNALLYRVEAGLLIVIPNTVQLFLQSEHLMDQYKEKDVTNGIEKVIKQLTLSHYFIPAPGRKNFIHHYTGGDWQKRQRISGLLIDPDSLFTESDLPPVMTDLQIDVV